MNAACENFKVSDAFIRLTNLKSLTHLAAHNHISDWPEEKIKKLLGIGDTQVLSLLSSEAPATLPGLLSATSYVQIPATIDWRTKGAVTPVRD